MFAIFKTTVQRYPNAIAIDLGASNTMTYQQISILVARWAGVLTSLGVKPGDRVALLTQSEKIHPIFYLALDALNATYVPLDMSIPKQQLHVDIEQLKLAYFFIDPELIATFALNKENLKCLYPLTMQDMQPAWTHLEIAPIPEIQRDPCVPNYIVASSGVSGDKKWIPILSPGLDYWLKQELPGLKLTAADRILCTRSPAYDARIFEYLMALGHGATLCLLERHERLDLNGVLHKVEQYRATVMLQIPSALMSLDAINIFLEKLKQAGLRHLLVTGEVCSPQLQDLCEQLGILLYNCYGPTEATFGGSILCVNGSCLFDENKQRIVPIGFPHGKEVKFHFFGECLYIESPHLSPGYLNAHHSTEKNFPYKLIANKLTRVFNTENRFTQAGNVLYFKGRTHSRYAHIKVFGEKVDPVGLEAFLNSYNQNVKRQVLQACVFVKKWREHNRLVAYLVLEKEFNQNDFFSYLRGYLRPAQMPIFLKLDQFPRLAVSDKIDLQQLENRVDRSDEYLLASPINTNDPAASDPLSAIYKEILRLEQVDPDLDFMLLGGNSLQLAQLVQQIQQTINPDYSIQQLMVLPAINLTSIRYSLASAQKLSNDRAIIQALGPVKPDRPNYFFLPPLLGEGYFTYKNLAESFKLTHQVNAYGLSDPGIYDERYLPDSMSHAIKRYISAIKSIQPHGPYKLLGFSFGATLALHVANCLIENGESVREIQIVDAFSPLLLKKLPREAHKELLEALLNFIIKTLTNRFYNEELHTVRLSEHESSSSIEEQLGIFLKLSECVQNPHSKNVLALARSHWSWMRQESSVQPCRALAVLNLSKHEQPYLNCIDSIPELNKRLPGYKTFLWDRYFPCIVLGGQRTSGEHLDLLAYSPRAEVALNPSAMFWNRGHDFLYNSTVQVDLYKPRIGYTVSPWSDSTMLVHLLHLDYRSLSALILQLAKLQEVKFNSFPSYQLVSSTAVHRERKDQFFHQLFIIKMLLPRDRCQQLLNELLSPSWQETTINHEVTAYASSQAITSQASPFNIQLDIYSSGMPHMSLHFNCCDIPQNTMERLKNIGLQVSQTEKTDYFIIPYDLLGAANANFFTKMELLSKELNPIVLAILPSIVKNELTLNNVFNLRDRLDVVDPTPQKRPLGK